MIGGPLLALAIALVPPAVTAAALFFGDAGWLAIAAGTITVFLATTFVVPLALWGSLLIGGIPALAVVENTNSVPIMYAAIAGDFAGGAIITSVVGGALIGGLTAGSTAGGTLLSDALE